VPPSLVLGLRRLQDTGRRGGSGQASPEPPQMWPCEGVEGAPLGLRVKWQLGEMHKESSLDQLLVMYRVVSVV